MGAVKEYAHRLVDEAMKQDAMDTVSEDLDVQDAIQDFYWSVVLQTRIKGIFEQDVAMVRKNADKVRGRPDHRLDVKVS